MACFRPVFAWRTDGGAIVFGAERKGVRSITLPCGYCMGCRLMRTRSWALRCMHEASMHAVNSFVTLTYDEEHYHPSLNYSDFQLFRLRLRRSRDTRVRYFCAGEYGEKFKRPHLHAILFGIGFSDLYRVGVNLFGSKELDKLWGKGFASVGTVTHESAMYVAKYCCKKVYGDRAVDHYSRVDLRTGEVVRVVPEFAHMSLKPGIGETWLRKYWKDVYVARDGVVLVGGQIQKPPRYYDKKLMEWNYDLAEYKEFERYVNSKRFIEDCTPERLADRERCAVISYARRISRL